MNIDNSRKWWPHLLPLLAGTIAVGADAWVVAGFLPALGSDMHVSTSAAGLSVTVFAIAYALGAPVLAALTSALRPRMIIMLALILLAGANTLCALSQTFALFMVGRVVAGLAACMVTPAAGVLAARVAGPDHRGRALALVIAGLTIATAIGVPTGSVLAQVGSWREALIAVAMLALVAAVMIRFTAPNPDGGRRQRITQRLTPLRDARVISVLGLTVLGMAATYVPYAYTSTLLPQGEDDWVTATLACYGIGAVAGSLASGYLTDKLGPARTLTVYYTAMVAAFVILATQPAAWVVSIGAIVWGGASWMQTPPQQHRLLAIHTDNAPVTIGSNASALYIGVALGNTTGGLLLNCGPETMCLTAAAVAVAALGWNMQLGRQP